MTPVRRSMLGLICFVAATAFATGGAQAFNWWGGDSQEESSGDSKGTANQGANIFSGGQHADTTAAKDPSSKNQSDTSIFVRTPRSGATGNASSGSSMSTPHPLYAADVERLGRMAGSETTMKFLSEMGISPRDYLRHKAMYDKHAAKYPDQNLTSPYAAIDLLTEGKKYPQALAEKIRGSCGQPGLQVILDVPSFMSNPNGKDNLNAKVVQPFGTVVSSICSMSDLRKQFQKGFYVLKIKNEPGNKQGTVSYNSVVFTISADFSDNTPISIQDARKVVLEGIKANAAVQDALVQKAEQEENPLQIQ